MICGAIFDIDGVLLDTLKIWRNIGSRYLISKGINPQDNTDEMLFSMSMEQGAEYLKNAYAIEDGAEKIIHDVKNMIKNFYEHEAREKDGAKEVTEFFHDKNIPVAAATSGPKEYQEKALKRNGIIIPKIYTVSELGESKHSSFIYDTAAKYLKTKPCETLVFEDSLYALKTAKNAGFVTVGIADKNGEPNQKEMRETADIYLENLSDFLQFKEIDWGDKNENSNNDCRK